MHDTGNCNELLKVGIRGRIQAMTLASKVSVVGTRKTSTLWRVTIPVNKLLTVQSETVFYSNVCN